MDYNSTSSSDGVGNGNGNGNSDGLVSPDYVSIVALVVSLIALLGTIAQVLQQYYASATGFSNCGESVMGDWHQSKRRIFRPTELRFEVQFEAPVLFVCPPANRRAPIRNAPILPISGSKESIKATRTPPSSEENENRNPVPPAQGNNVHTADNERATWVTLLSELQLMERDSQDWLQAQYGINTLNIPPYTQREAEYGGRTLVVALQVKRRSWDTMPAGVQKPYATTTMCHLLEIAAIMGIYWREFDRSRDRYRAEGNGYMLTGEKVADLGIVFTFQLCGKRRFKENRVIPVHEVKELCCGVVTTIFREGTDNSMLELLELLDDSRDLNWLQLGSRNEIAESLVLLGCNTATASYFRNEHKKHSHLFPGKPRNCPTKVFPLLSVTLTNPAASRLRTRRHAGPSVAHPQHGLPHGAEPDAVPVGQKVLLAAQAAHRIPYRAAERRADKADGPRRAPDQPGRGR